MSEVQIIALACDHGGYALKESIKCVLEGRYEVLDLGTHSDDSVDYPDFGHALAEAIESGQAQRGIAICGSGIGISIALNRHKAVRCGLCTNVEMARLTRAHNDANVLALGARIIDEDTALACVEAFLGTDFEGGRHAARVAKL